MRQVLPMLDLGSLRDTQQITAALSELPSLPTMPSLSKLAPTVAVSPAGTKLYTGFLQKLAKLHF